MAAFGKGGAGAYKKKVMDRENARLAAKKAAAANTPEKKMEAGRDRAKELYGMDSTQVGEKTQDVIARTESKLGSESGTAAATRNRSNTLKRAAAASKGSNLTSGESSQIDRQGSFDASTQQQGFDTQNLAMYRSLIGNIASNTGALEMGMGNIGVASQPTQVARPSSGITVICTELKRQGLLPKEVWELDRAYGLSVDFEIWYGYYIWAKHVAKLMKKSKLITKLVAPLAIAWAYHISGKKNTLGAIINFVGLKVCKVIGKITYKRETIHE